jgi:L-fuconolactonase
VSAPRIDAHQHFWQYDPREYAWIDDNMPALRRDFLPPQAAREMARAGFDACVAVQALQTDQETRWLLDLADAHPFIAGVVGWVDLRAPDIDRRLTAMTAHPKLVGVRHIVQAEPDGFLARPDVRRGVAALDRAGFAFDILVYAHQLPQAADFAAAFPHQRFVLDHLGKPAVRAGAFDTWLRDLRRLATLPNVCAKLSGLVTEADWHGWMPADLRRYIDAALVCFGADRLMIGSDWPVCTVAGTYADVMQVVVDAVAELAPGERDAVLGGNAQRFWRLSSVEERA